MLNRQNGKFTIVSNDVINRGDLSAKAKGVYMYLQSKPEGWQFYETEIVKNFTDGKDSIKSGVVELIQAKLLLKYQEREGGKFSNTLWILNPTEADYSLYSTVSGKPVNGKPDDGKIVTGKPATNNTNSNKTYFKKTYSSGREDFKKFKERILEEAQANPDYSFTMEGLGYLASTKFIIKGGLIHNSHNGTIVDRNEAFEMWQTLYREATQC